MDVGSPLKAAAVFGGLVIAAAGAVMGSQNAGWFGLARNANALFPLLGVGVLLILAGWGGSGWTRTLWRAGRLGKAAAALLAIGAVFFLLNPLLQFAIFGTLSFAIGLGLFATLLWRERLLARADRVMASVAAVGSLTWNTETVSAFLLVGVGVLLAILSLRMGHAPTVRDAAPPGHDLQ